MQNNIWWLGLGYERGETRYLRDLLQPGMTAFDVGANVGYYTLLAALQVGDAGSVHSFEPVADQYAALCANIHRNHFRNVVANKKIVSDKAGSMAIRYGPADNSGAASVVDQPGLGDRTETVAAVALDDYADASTPGPIHVIKIDTEGHELAVLKGATRILQHRQTVVLVEIRSPHLQRAGVTRDDVYSFMSQLGYQPFAIRNDGTLAELSAPQDGKLIVFKPR